MGNVIFEGSSVWDIFLELTEFWYFFIFSDFDFRVVQGSKPWFDVVFIVADVLVLLLELKPARAWLFAVFESSFVDAYVRSELAVLAVELSVFESSNILEFENLFGEFGIGDFPSECALFHLSVLHQAVKNTLVFGDFELPLSVESIVAELADVGDFWGLVLASAVEVVINKVPNIVPVVTKPFVPFTVGFSVSELSLDNWVILVPYHTVSLWLALLVQLPDVNTVFKLFNLMIRDLYIDLGFFKLNMYDVIVWVMWFPVVNDKVHIHLFNPNCGRTNVWWKGTTDCPTLRGTLIVSYSFNLSKVQIYLFIQIQ